jgi:anti-sigma factor RsiW
VAPFACSECAWRAARLRATVWPTARLVASARTVPVDFPPTPRLSPSSSSADGAKGPGGPGGSAQKARGPWFALFFEARANASRDSPNSVGLGLDPVRRVQADPAQGFVEQLNDEQRYLPHRLCWLRA